MLVQAVASAQFCNQPQNLLEHLPGDGDLIWKAMLRPWLMTLAPILMSFSFRLDSDQSLIGSGVASVRRKLPRL